MNFEKIIRKIDRYIHRELKYLIRETTVLKDLKKDVEQIEQLLSEAKRSKDSSLLLAHYKKEAESEEKYSERIERRLNSLIERITKLMLSEEEEGKLTVSEKESLDKFRSHIEVTKNNLARILAWDGELHHLIKEQKSWKEIERKVNEALGNTNNPGLNSLIVLLEGLEKLEKEFKKLEARRRFLKLGAAAAVVAGASGMLMRNYFSIRKLPYQYFKEDLERYLNSGDFRKAKSFIEDSHKIIIPITNEVIAQLTEKFNHQFEIGFILFANRKGVIDHAYFPKQRGAPGAVGYEWEECKTVILEQQDEGRVYVGDFHTHPRTKEAILAFRDYLKRTDEEYKKSDPSSPKTDEYEGTTPSDADLGVFFSGETIAMIFCRRDANCDPIYEKLRQKGAVTLIGGLTYPQFDFRIRAFFSLVQSEGKNLNLSTIGKETLERIKEEHRKKYDELLEYVEFTIKPVSSGIFSKLF